MTRTIPSFVSLSNARFAPADIDVSWHDSDEYGGCYIVDLGPDASIHLNPEDAPDLLTKLAAAMIARGERIELPRADADAAEERQRGALHLAAVAIEVAR